MIIQVLRQTPYNFSYLASSATENVIVADRIPVSGARTIALSVRVHHLTLSAGASFQFLVYGVDPSATDGTVFITSASIGDTGTITTSSPNLVGLSAIISDSIYPFVRVVLRANGPSSTGTTYFEVSADLVVRSATTGLGRRSGGCSAKCGSGGIDSLLSPDGPMGTSGAPTPAGSSLNAPDHAFGCFCVSTINNTWWEQPCNGDGTAPPCFGAGYKAGRCADDGKSPYKDPITGVWGCK